jgi:phosphoenolpyruvate---glycerone phosphotransferase subunit DhaL
VTAQLNAQDLRRALAGITARLIECTEELNTLDAALGDADLGGTLASISKSVQSEIETLPDDLGEALLRVVKAFSRTSGSSFSGVVMAGIMRGGMKLRGRETVDTSELSALLRECIATMSERGGAKLGDKSLLDGIAAIATALEGHTDTLAAEADRAVASALDAFRDQPSKIGRARLAGERSIGRDDPGMVALKRMIEGLKS